MSLLSIIKLSSYIYLLTSLLLPDEMIYLTAQLLSYIIIQPVHTSEIIPHVLKSIVLLVGFVVLFTILGGNAIYTHIQQFKGDRKNKPIIKKKPTIIKNDNGKKPQKQLQNNVVTIKEKSAVDNTPMQSSADLMLKSTTTVEKEMEPMTAIPIINNNISNEPTNNSNIITSPTAITNHQLNETDIIEPISIIVERDESEITSQLNDNKESIKLPNINNDDIITAPEEKPSVVNTILAQDQLTKEDYIPTTTATITQQHVIPSATVNTTIEEEIKREIVQPEKITEATIPQPKSEEQQPEEEEHNSTTTTSTTVTPPAEPSSDDPKEQYYSEIIKKDSNLMSLSDNLQHIFGEPPSTPIPQLLRLESFISHAVDNHNDDIITNNNNKRPASVQSSIDEMMSTATPALTPPKAGSTSSRRSSTTSNKSSLAFKSRLQTAMQKVARSGPRQSPQQQPQQPQQPLPPLPQKQQTMDTVIAEPSNSSSLAKNKKSRFSSLRLTRKKSTGSLLFTTQQQQPQPEPPVIEAKKSVSSKLQNKFKKSGKRLSKIFS